MPPTGIDTQEASCFFGSRSPANLHLGQEPSVASIRKLRMDTSVVPEAETSRFRTGTSVANPNTGFIR